jgi:hypothetical protein
MYACFSSVHTLTCPAISGVATLQDKYHTGKAAFQDAFWVFAKDWKKLGCESDDATFNAYVINPTTNVFQPDAAKSAPIATKCVSIKAGIDPNTGIRGRKELQTSSLTFPYHDKENEPKQAGAKVGWILGSTVRCSVFDRSLHSRVPLVPTHASSEHACGQWHSSQESTFSWLTL